MKRFIIALAVAAATFFFAWAAYAMLSAPPEPVFGWRQSISVAQHDAQVASLDHHYRVAAYAVTWAIQLGYLAWLGLKWLAQSRTGKASS